MPRGGCVRCILRRIWKRALPNAGQIALYQQLRGYEADLARGTIRAMADLRCAGS